MKIRFIVRVAGYKSIIMNIVEKIIPFLPEDKYEIYESDYNPKTNKYTDAENKECINVSFFTEYKEHKEVFISHGIADKNWRNKDSVSQFDYLIVSGELWRQKYIKQGISPERIKVLGYPKLSNLPKITKKDIQNDNKIRVLFAPTHSALEEVSAYPRFVKYLKSFPAKEIENVDLYSDSQLVVKQLNGFYKIKNAKLRSLIIEVRRLEQEVGGNVFYHQISREKNQEADDLVNLSLA